MLRLVICARADCRQVFYLCRVCDRGDRYCSRACAYRARRATLHDAGRRGQRTLSGFVLVLSWSRACYARFALDQTLESFLRGHVAAFAALGSVPRTIVYDNLKSVVPGGPRRRIHIPARRGTPYAAPASR